MPIEYIIVAFIIAGVALYLKRKKEKEMPVGLQTFDENGEVNFDSSATTTKILGSFSTGTSNGSKTISVTDGYKLWAVLSGNEPISVSSGVMYYFPEITINGNTISWNFDAGSGWLGANKFGGAKVSAKILYGEY